MKCSHCEAEFQPTKDQVWRAKQGNRVFCSTACSIESRKKKVPMFRDCAQCGKNFELNHAQNWKAATGKTDEFFCSRGCATQWKHAHSEALKTSLSSESKRSKAREALAQHNWLQTPEAVEKNRQTRIARKSNSRKIAKRGGNGADMAVPQRMLADALQWQTEFVVTTGATRGSGMPHHYRLDMAHPELKIAVEVDGRSHNWEKVKESDARKDAFLASLGWNVLRFSNTAVMDDLAGCVQTVTSTMLRLLAITTSSQKEF